MKKKVIDIIGLVVIGIIITVFSFIIGANDKPFRTLTIGILFGVTIIYLIVRKLLLKENIVIKNKTDIFVSLFFISTLLPILFKTRCSLEGSIEYAIKYFFAYSTYLLGRNVVDGKKKVNIVIRTILASSLIIAVFAIDSRYNYSLKPFLKKFYLDYNITDKMYGTFGYANTLAAYFSLCMFMAIGQLQTTKKKIGKVLYALYIALSIFIIFNTSCNALIIILPIVLLIYLSIYYKAFVLKHIKKFLVGLLALSIVFIISIIYVFSIGIKYSKSYYTSKENFTDMIKHKFNDEKEYNFEINYEIKDYEKDDKIKFSIEQINEYEKYETLVTEEIKESEGTINLKFNTGKKVLMLNLLIDNPYSKNIEIKKCYIDGKEYILNYKYIPSKLGRFISKHGIKNRSLEYRKLFFEDSIKLFKMHPIIGNGGNTWLVMATSVEQWDYSVKASHSYFTELLFSYGIIGLLLFLIPIVLINIKALKNREENLTLLIGLDILLVHALTFEFHMSFVIIQLIVFLSLALLQANGNNKNYKIKSKIYEVFVLLTMFVVFMCSVHGMVAEKLCKNIQSKKIIGFYDKEYSMMYLNINMLTNESINPKFITVIKETMDKEPYMNQSDITKMFFSTLFSNYSEYSMDEKIENLEYITNYYLNIKNKVKYSLKNEVIKLQVIKAAKEKLEEANESFTKKYIDIFDKIIEDEYKEYMEYLDDRVKNRYTDETLEKIKISLDKIME